MKKKQIIKFTSGTVASFTLLKAFQNSADPYTRIAIGSVLTLGAFTLAGREIGFGVGLGSLLQGTEIAFGGKITKNHFPKPIIAIKENQDLFEIPATKLHEGTIEGFTYKGLNGIFKLSDGVHCQIDKTGKINVSGLGAFVNTVKKGGFHDKKWCELLQTKGDERWIRLYNESV